MTFEVQRQKVIGFILNSSLLTTPTMSPEKLNVLLTEFPALVGSEFRGQARVRVPPAMLFDLLSRLRDRHGFDQLSDITCVDYLRYRGATDRFALVYVLCGTQSGERLIVRSLLNEPDLEVPSAVPLWNGAEWLEREVWDMFGIRFVGHPDLRRILLPEEFTAFPLRKDYPLQGLGERHNFPFITRGSA